MEVRTSRRYAQEPETERSAWRVDAWAVEDGKAFVSRREPGSIDAQVTVFLSVPDLEPVPVGRISTALRATRSGFQAGLRDEDGGEIAFDSLDAVRSLVRRAYLGSGLGPDAPAAATGPVTRTPGPDDAGARRLAEHAWSHEPWETVELSSEPPRRLPRAVDLMIVGSLLSWDRYLDDEKRGRPDPEELRCLVGWLAALESAGLLGPAEHRDHHLLDEVRDRASRLGAERLERSLRLLDEAWAPWAPFRGGGADAGYWSRTHLALVPLPLAPGWDRRMCRLVEMQIAATVDRTFWTTPRPVTTLDIAPLVLVRAARRGLRRGYMPGEEPPALAVFRDLSAALEDAPLPEAAERALAAFLDRRLDGGTPSRGPEPATAGPGFGPSAGPTTLRW